MMEIEVKIKIQKVENWKTDWENEDEKKKELKELAKDIKNAMSDHCGIDSSKIYITAEITPQP